MSFRAGPTICGNRRRKSLDNLGRIIDRKRCLGQISHFGWVRHFQPIHVRRLLDQVDRLRRFAHRADDLIVAGMADQQNRVPLLGKTDGFQVNLGHNGQVTSMVFRRRAPPAVEFSGGTPWAEYSRCSPSGTSVRSPTKTTPLPPEPINYPLVVDDLVVDV